MNKIAIFGSTGHIGKNLISFLANDKNCDLILFSRNSKKSEMLKNLFPESSLVIEEYDKFESNKYDVIINCVGITNPVDITEYYSKILEVGEFYDSKIINFLKKSPSTLYINMSSGAVYDTEFDSPVDDKTSTILDINNNSSVHYYALSKINSETKHRLNSELNIIDLRIFNFFSKYIELNSGFFLSELINAISNNVKFITNDADFVRDYINPYDFFSLIKNCIQTNNINDTFDVYSKEPISKSRILEEMSNKFNLEVEITDEDAFSSPTGFKKNYYSISRKTAKISYEPKYSSLETILSEAEVLLKRNL